MGGGPSSEPADGVTVAELIEKLKAMPQELNAHAMRLCDCGDISFPKDDWSGRCSKCEKTSDDFRAEWNRKTLAGRHAR